MAITAHTVTLSHCQATTGVPPGKTPGSVVGPCLFLIYITGLPQSVKSEVRLYADDTVTNTAANKRDQLQADPRALQDWETLWDMEFNPSKCEHITFTRKKSKISNKSYSLLNNHNSPQQQHL